MSEKNTNEGKPTAKIDAYVNVYVGYAWEPKADVSKDRLWKSLKEALKVDDLDIDGKKIKVDIHRFRATHGDGNVHDSISKKSDEADVLVFDMGNVKDVIVNDKIQYDENGKIPYRSFNANAMYELGLALAKGRGEETLILCPNGLKASVPESLGDNVFYYETKIDDKKQLSREFDDVNGPSKKYLEIVQAAAKKKLAEKEAAKSKKASIAIACSDTKDNEVFKAIEKCFPGMNGYKFTEKRKAGEIVVAKFNNLKEGDSADIYIFDVGNSKDMDVEQKVTYKSFCPDVMLQLAKLMEENKKAGKSVPLFLLCPDELREYKPSDLNHCMWAFYTTTKTANGIERKFDDIGGMSAAFRGLWTGLLNCTKEVEEAEDNG